jgi:hypothetical protein
MGRPTDPVVAAMDEDEQALWRRWRALRLQCERRARMRRIDYYASPAADAVIDGLRSGSCGGDASSIINRIIGSGLPEANMRGDIRSQVAMTAISDRVSQSIPAPRVAIVGALETSAAPYGKVRSLNQKSPLGANRRDRCSCPNAVIPAAGTYNREGWIPVLR